MSDQNKLTAEEISKELQGFFTGRKPLHGKNPEYPAILIQEYAAQQTAEKDARIKELENEVSELEESLKVQELARCEAQEERQTTTEELEAAQLRVKELEAELSRIMELCGVQHVNGKGGATVAVSYIIQERKKLARWKKEQISVFSPLLDYGQSKESGLPLGGSIVKEAIKALKERKELREELEAVKKERADLKYALRAVEEERDGEALKNENAHLTIARKEQSIDDLNNNYAILKAQRDEAVKLLDIAAIHHVPIKDQWQDQYIYLKKQLSSGETKPERVESDREICPICDLDLWIKYRSGHECANCGYTEEITPSNNSSSEQERCTECDNGYTTSNGVDTPCKFCNSNHSEIPNSSPASPWISVEDRLTGIEIIKEERERQINKLEYTANRDKEYLLGELAIAGSVYAKPPFLREMRVDPLEVDLPEPQKPVGWPWSAKYWKPCPNNRVRELAKAGALIAAEIDRLLRLPAPPESLTDKTK